MREIVSIGTTRYAVRGDLAIAGSFHDGAVVIENGVIVDVTRSNRDGELPRTVLDAEIVAPGLIDLQVNGGFGYEVDTNTLNLEVIESRLPASGVTSYLPTVISSPYSFYEQFLAMWDDDPGRAGTRRLGVHLEGPFLSPIRKGAHPVCAIEAADDRLFELIMDSFDVALVTIAPEEPGNLERIKRLRDAEVAVSIGHTNATVDQVLAGVDAGASMATHLFNAMSPFNHRAPAAIGAVMTDDRLVAGLIVDGVHAHPLAIDLAVRAKGVERIALVSDMMAAAGMPAGEYTLGGQVVRTDGISVRLPDGTLAGSVLLMDEAIRNVARWASVSPAQAIRMATEVPAGVLRRDDIGVLRPGAFADLTLFDHHLNVVRTIVDGLTVFSAPG
jgi:N-acetylglucosamine-6-phosphate deacetylase